MEYPGPLYIAKNQHLSPAEAAVEASFAQQVQEHLEEMVAEYQARFGTTIDTDRARELCQEYRARQPRGRSFHVRRTIQPRRWQMRCTAEPSTNCQEAAVSSFLPAAAQAQARVRP